MCTPSPSHPHPPRVSPSSVLMRPRHQPGAELVGMSQTLLPGLHVIGLTCVVWLVSVVEMSGVLTSR
jgi:hypothetical protein